MFYKEINYLGLNGISYQLDYLFLHRNKLNLIL